MLTPAAVHKLLSPFGLELSGPQTDCLLVYLELLLRWNRSINLTAIRKPEECVTRHFGESLYLIRWASLRGRLLDIGSGAGFPGLALKMACPELELTLLEPAAKKRAFLKEVARTCRMDSVEVRHERLEDFARQSFAAPFESVTSRAVGRLGGLVASAAKCLKPAGRLCLWLSREQAETLPALGGDLQWALRLPIPMSRRREICVGTLVAL